MTHIHRGGTADLLPHLKASLDFDDLHMVFQPIVSLRTGALFAYEALLRSRDPSFPGPAAMVEESVRRGCVGELGRRVREMAVAGCPTAPLFVNIHPGELNEEWIVRADDPILFHEFPVYIEIVESAPFEATSCCRGALEELRGKGARIVVDDLGAGYSNLAYIADLTPDVVKLDRALIAGTALGSRRACLIAALSELCANMGALVVAEGIETLTELEVARRAGVDLVQGYLFARPAAPPPLPRIESLRDAGASVEPPRGRPRSRLDEIPAAR